MHAAVCDFIIDCIQNSVEAESGEIKILIDEDENLFRVSISDNGIGMTDEQQKRAVDPFYTDGKKHKERKVGLGLPFLIQAVQQVDGEWSLKSEAGKGTELFFSFCKKHLDMPPVGDISGMLLQAMMFDGDFELDVSRFIRTADAEGSYRIKRTEIIEVLGDLNDADSLIMARAFLKSQEQDLIEGDR